MARHARVRFQEWLADEFGVHRPIREEDLSDGGVMKWYNLPTGLTIVLQIWPEDRGGFSVLVPASDSLSIEADKQALKRRVEERKT